MKYNELYSVGGVCYPEPHAEVYCLQLNLKYQNWRNGRIKFTLGWLITIIFIIIKFFMCMYSPSLGEFKQKYSD